MENLPANAVDLSVIGVLLISGILAYSRGLVRELLSVAGWVGAIIATFYGFFYAQPLARKWIEIPIIADAAAGTVIFVVTLILLTLISHAIASYVKHSALGAIDHSLGFLFGLLRGVVLVCLAYLVLAWVMPEDERPQWMVTARTIPLVEQGAELMFQLVPEAVLKRGEETAGEVQEKIDKEIDETVERQRRRMLEDLTSPAAKDDAPGETEGYNKDERRDMDRLIQGQEKP